MDAGASSAVQADVVVGQVFKTWEALRIGCEPLHLFEHFLESNEVGFSQKNLTDCKHGSATSQSLKMVNGDFFLLGFLLIHHDARIFQLCFYTIDPIQETLDRVGECAG